MFPLKQRTAAVYMTKEGRFSDSADCPARSDSIVVRKEIEQVGGFFFI